MQPNILVTYATRLGSTAGVAESIGRVLSQYASVDILPVSDVTDVYDYDAVIVGSAIRIGNWLPEAILFLERFRDDLRYKPVAFFTVCVTLSTDNEANRKQVLEWMQPVSDLIKPRDIGLFAGRLMFDEMPFLTRLAARVIGVPQGEYRNWEKIRAWAAQLPEKLLTKEVVS